MPGHHPIDIRFIRRRSNDRAEANPQFDDILKIHKLGENNLRVTYVEQTEDGVMRDTTMMTYQKLVHYLLRVFWMLSIDEDPFQSVQLIIPAHPQILIGVSTLQTHLPVLLEIIVGTCWHWPVISRREMQPQPQSQSVIDTTPTEDFQ
ncbi:hypothetical protein EBZ80_09080 [bacterium]|nr:hypothetical protein [bacterium]